MKRRDLIKEIEKAGFILERHGAEHDIYLRKDDEKIEVPRHKEINEITAKKILKKCGLT